MGRELRHPHCIFTDDFTIFSVEQGYCAFCDEQSSELYEVELNEQYPRALEHMLIGRPKAMCRDGRTRRFYMTSQPKRLPVRATLKVDMVSVSGFVYWSELDNMMKFRARPEGANYNLLPEPPFGHEVNAATTKGALPQWTMHPEYEAKLIKVLHPGWEDAIKAPSENSVDTDEGIDYSSSDRVETFDPLEDAP